MNEETENLSNVSKDNSIIQQLAGFDFSSPVQVNIIFDDDEDQSSSPKNIKEEKTETIENNKSTTAKNETNIIKTQQGNFHNICQEKKVQQLHDDTLCSSHTNFNKNPIEIKKENSVRSIPEQGNINSTKNLKRKSNVECCTETKMCKNDNLIHVKSKNASQSEQNTPQKFASIAEVAANNNVNIDNSNTEMTCITNLLKSVSGHLILVIEAYKKYAEIKDNRALSSSEKECHRIHFLKIKHHFFNLSFCTVDNIILPQENNILFTGQFLNNTAKLAASKNKMICVETQIAPLFFELLHWCKQKKLYVSNLTSGSGNFTKQSEHNPVLRQHLQVHPQQSQSFQSNSFGVPPKQFDFYRQNCQPSDNLNRAANTLSSGYNNGAHFTSAINSYVVSPRKTMQPKNNKHDPSSKLQTPTATNNFIPPNNGVENKNVLFSTGPPERRISISVEQSLLDTCSTYNANNPIVTSQTTSSLKKSKIPNGENLPPSYEQSCQSRQSTIQANQFYMQQSQQVVTKQNFSNNLYVQNTISQSPHAYQNTIPKAPQPPWMPNVQINHNGSVEMQRAFQAQPLQVQNEHQNPDNTRSLSTDSGFMSPVNFNSFTETNKDEVDDNQLPSPVITHITTLHPKASYIAEGLCFVCGKPTRQMCVGCYKRYYCSNHCQAYDWDEHKSLCNINF